MSSIKEVSKKSGFSISTVSRALNGYDDVSLETKEKIMKIANELNYFPNAGARSLVKKTSNLVGVFFGDINNSGFDHPFFLDVISALREELGEAGYDLVIFANKHKGSATFVTLCKERSVDGVILLLSKTSKRFTKEMKELKESDIPCVAIDVPILGKRCSYLESNNYEGAKKAVTYLIENGHKKIGLIGGDDISKLSFERLRGYKDALLESDLEINPEYIQESTFSLEKAAEITRDFVKLGLTALFVVSDEMAEVVIKTINLLGKSVPEDMSVVGFDDIKEAMYFRPPLTTVRQQKYEMGRYATKELVKIINNKEHVCRAIELPCELVIRDSVRNLNIQ